MNMTHRMMTSLFRPKATGGQNNPKMLIKNFYQRGMTDEQKFLERITKSENGCWVWAGPFKEVGRHQKKFIYGRFPIKTEDGKWKSVYAHIFSYTHFKGTIPEGHEIHHGCNNQICVNPEHLETVTKPSHMMKSNWLASINVRKTHCKNGHPYDLHYKDGRRCSICTNEWHRKYYANVRRIKLIKGTKPYRRNGMRMGI